ncbi:MAG: nucleotide sugar dehydrogenase [Aeromicrobium sp.]|nr:nucleotide sugar dehydrogenase [Aeromicrobium sp.]
MATAPFIRDVVIVGGCGRVGLPLAIAFAQAGLRTTSFDINPTAVTTVNGGSMPFDEPDSGWRLAAVRQNGMFDASTDPNVLSEAEHVVVVVGTPVDEHLNPDPQVVRDAIKGVVDHLRDGQLIVLRSTVFPGVTRLVEQFIESTGLDIEVSFCPERIAEGKAFVELFELPQIVSGRSASAVERATALFKNISNETVELIPEEAELAKLFTNTWRYIRFAAANQLYMIANDYGLDFERIRAAVRYNYPRAADMPGAGLAAGPCLLKDTMQLAAFHENNFTLGHASMMVNEGLPLYIVGRMEREHDLSKLTVGILGMAFKADSDDIRSSLSYKLRRILRFKAADVLCSDPFVHDPTFVDQDDLLARADVIVIGAPHTTYRDLETAKPVVDIWNVMGEGVRI